MNQPLHLTPDASAHAPRLDLYAPIHKALRAWMFDTLVAVGQTDGLDDAQLERTLGRVAALLGVCQQHILHESEFMHPALAACGAKAPLKADLEHDEHHHAMAGLLTQVQVVRAAQAAERLPALTQLYRQLALFVADNLTHMHLEETAHNEWLWGRFSDPELGALHDRLVQSIPPQEMAGVLRWMLPAVSHTERLGMLQDMRSKMPPGAFEGVLQLAQDTLPVMDWAALLRGLGLQPCLPQGALAVA